jgi:hypothetical protein
MIRIKIMPPPWCDHSQINERGWLELPDHATLNDALMKVKCSVLQAKFLLASVNGERVSFSTQLKDGDVVGFFMLCVGG